MKMKRNIEVIKMKKMRNKIKDYKMKDKTDIYNYLIDNQELTNW